MDEIAHLLAFPDVVLRLAYAKTPTYIGGLDCLVVEADRSKEQLWRQA
jgi:hypothetical protein